MVNIDQVDAVVIAAVESFLAECTGPHQLLGEEEVISMADNGLLLDGHRLLSETETAIRTQEVVNALDVKSTDGSTGEDDAPMMKEEPRATRDLKAVKRRQRYRIKQKAEEAQLARQEIELSKKLTLLQARKKSVAKQMQRVGLRAWKTCALRQKEKRIKAEEYRELLRAAVINRSRVIHKMKALMMEAIPTETLNLKNVPPEGNSALLKTFVHELDSIYAQTDAVFQTADFKLSYPMVYHPVRQNYEGLQIYESADKTFLPFEFEQVSRALSMLILNTDGSIYTVKTVDPANTSAMRCDYHCSLDSGDSTTISGYIATRQYREADRLVFVWHALYEGQEEFADLHSIETGWIVVYPSSGDDSVDGKKSTVLMSFSRLIPMGLANSGVSVDKFGEIVVKAGEDDVKQTMGMLEKMLISAP
ncbi:hypothetical protein PHYBOEH_002554 [Phytophthora boehmeriae]|uniref:M96 mating-specific protein family n=1 Tax=Phytophthora boehmeriae TaxID=109152 RepID=A0A8T1WS03_9STRA|nr:hypothetical protein PHYBOEH_002554 [Phytophthora boehmeriae]